MLAEFDKTKWLRHLTCPDWAVVIGHHTHSLCVHPHCECQLPCWATL